MLAFFGFWCYSMKVAGYKAPGSRLGLKQQLRPEDTIGCRGYKAPGSRLGLKHSMVAVAEW